MKIQLFSIICSLLYSLIILSHKHTYTQSIDLKLSRSSVFRKEITTGFFPANLMVMLLSTLGVHSLSSLNPYFAKSRIDISVITSCTASFLKRTIPFLWSTSFSEFHRRTNPSNPTAIYSFCLSEPSRTLTCQRFPLSTIRTSKNARQYPRLRRCCSPSGVTTYLGLGRRSYQQNWRERETS